jgi:hypothetical protein
LEKIIAGEQPAPIELLKKIAQQFPGLDLGWLFCGWGRMFTQEPWGTRNPVDEAIDRDVARYKERRKMEQWLLEESQGEDEKRLQKQADEWLQKQEEQATSPENKVVVPATKGKKQSKPIATTQKKPTTPK